MKPLCIGVSGLNAADNPGPGVGVARALKKEKTPITVVGLAYDAMEPGIYLDWLVDRTFLMPYPSGGGEAFVQRLGHIKATVGLDLVIPNLDTELPLYMRHEAELSAMGIKVFIPTESGYELRGKDRLVKLAGELGLSVPKTVVAPSLDAFTRGLETMAFPLMVKGAFYKALRAETAAQAYSHFHTIAADWGYPVLLQEVVTGDELNVVGVGDGEGGHLGLVGIKKMMVTNLGKIWTGVSVRHEKMLEAAARFVAAVKWRGPFELECIVHGDTVNLIEINPRFPAWSYFATAIGVPLVGNLVRKALGLPVAPEIRDYEAGKLFIRYTDETVGDQETFQKLILNGEH